jgi:hypothetical protein
MSGAEPRTETTAGGHEPLAAALAYAARGWHVFPVKTDKTPRTVHGLKDATTDVAQIRSWWARWPDAGVAIRTGAVSGLMVLDVDVDRGGDETLFELEREHGELPLTPRVKTPSGGTHFYFRHPGGEVPNSTDKIGPGLDVRGDGGYVVAPPSEHSSGRTYDFDVDPDKYELAGVTLAGAERRNGRARPVSEWRHLAAEGVAAGTRNDRTARLAGHLLARGVDPYVVLELLAAWNQGRNRPPLPDEEVFRVVESIAAREAAKWTG